MSAVLGKCSLVALGFFAAAVAHGGDQAKPAKRYELTPIVATNDAQCEPGFVASTFTRRINASGQVIGYHQCYEATGVPETPFLFNSGWGYLFTPGVGSRLLPTIGADSLGTFGRSVNDAGVAVGYEFTQDSILAPLWLPSGGASYAVEPDPCGSFASAQADDINNKGSIAAAARRATAGCAVAWILKRADGTETQVIGSIGRPDAMNDQDVLVGQKLNTAVKWSQTRGIVALGPEGVPGRERLRAFNINNREQVVGEWQHFDLNDQCLKGADAVFWASDGNAQTLERLRHDTDAIALGINDQGLIVGNSRSHTGCNTFDPDLQRAVIWHKGRVTDLNKLLDKSDAREIQLIQASDINERGQIAATGFYRNQPLDNCWDFVFNPDTEELVYDTTLTCRSVHAFLLTPKKDK